MTLCESQNGDVPFVEGWISWGSWHSFIFCLLHVAFGTSLLTLWPLWGRKRAKSTQRCCGSVRSYHPKDKFGVQVKSLPLVSFCLYLLPHPQRMEGGSKPLWEQPDLETWTESYSRALGWWSQWGWPPPNFGIRSHYAGHKPHSLHFWGG